MRPSKPLARTRTLAIARPMTDAPRTTADQTGALPTTFDPAAIEARWYPFWEEGGWFRPERPDAEPFTIVNPPPNVTGALHVGHALDNTLQDVIVRFERLRGRDALWVVGTDHAGIATQMVVERNLASQGVKRTDMSREAFVEHVWEWKEQSGGSITRQLRRLGCSMDWSREQFTMDPHFERAVTEAFVRLHEAGLIYRDKRLVNWDPALKTAISDLEVETREMKGSFWRFRYPLADGATLDDGRATIEVATTRPETMLADMAVAVHPSDERYASVVGREVVLPITGRRVPVVADEHADPELGSGAVKITPGHDFNDFEVGKRAGIEPAAMLNMFDAEARVVQCGGVPEELVGLDRFEARDRVVALLKESGHLIAWRDKNGEEHDAEPRTIQTPYGDRGGVVIEPWLTDQWYVDAKNLAEGPIEAVRSGEVEIVPETWEKTFFNWMENIQPWCVSRQLWWGHRVPVWYGFGLAAFAKNASREERQNAIGDQLFFVARNEKEAEKIAAIKYSEVLNQGEFQVEAGRASGARFEPDKTVIYLSRDPDVLDTWFSSALWPFATLGWPEDGDATSQSVRAEVVEASSITLNDSTGKKNGPSTGSRRTNSLFASSTPLQGLAYFSGDEDSFRKAERTSLLQKHYPNDLLISGFDILFFWDARMMMMGRQLTGENPWKRLYLHGLVRAKGGEKMSKSKGNVVDPLGLIERFGADALRFFMAAMESQGRDIKLDERRIEGYRNFATKLWNAARFCEANGIGASETLAAPPARMAVNQWIIGEIAETARRVEAALDGLRFDAAADAIYHFAWDRFCDWYLELIKPVFDGDAATPPAAETRAVAGWALDQILVMLHPFMPFITEELWQRLGAREDYPLIAARWPDPQGQPSADAVEAIEWLIALTTATRAARTELGIAPGAVLPAFCPAPSDRARATVERSAKAVERMARLAPIAFDDPPPGPAMEIAAGEDRFLVPLEGVIDVDAERARLTKALAASEKELAGLDKRLGNASFVERAKPEAVEKARADRSHHAAEAERLRAALARLA